jgi:hypothetical protein
MNNTMAMITLPIDSNSIAGCVLAISDWLD